VSLRIDAHQHFWRISRGDYPWLTPDAYPVLYQDYGPADLEPQIKAAGVDRTVLVQGAETLDETRFLLSIAHATPFVAAVVGWADFTSPSGPDDIAALAEDRKLRSLRPMLQDMDEKDWILRPELAPSFRQLEQSGLVFDVLIKPPHLPHIPALLDRYGGVQMVIDHGAKPYIAAGEIEPWRAQMLEIARRPNVWCKFSGLVTEAGDWWDVGKLKPYVDVLIEAFTPGRLMWGSDWPVLRIAGEYAGWRAAAGELTAHLSDAEKDDIFGGAATRFYGLADA